MLALIESLQTMPVLHSSFLQTARVQTASSANVQARCIRHGERIGKRTNTHNDHEPSDEPSKLNDAAAPTVHEIIWIRRSPTYPVRCRCEHVGRYDDQGEVVLVQCARENYKEEADCEDLRAKRVSGLCTMLGRTGSAEADNCPSRASSQQMIFWSRGRDCAGDVRMKER